MKDNSCLKHLLEQAWEEVRQSPNHHLTLITRLSIYDALLQLPDGALFDLIVRQNDRLLPETKGLKTYQLLGLLTATKLLPLWDSDMKKLLETPEYQGYDPLHLPHIILRSAYMLYKGHTLDEVDEMIASNYEVPSTSMSFHVMYGNLNEELWHSQTMVIAATYDVFLSMSRIAPFSVGKQESLMIQIEDNEIHYASHHDTAYHSCEAYCTDDPNPPGWDKPRLIPIQREPLKALEFWQWWLFEAIPKAERLDVSDLSVLE